ncbi:MAG: Hpt domain-containing protein [Pseudomonadota bacterium]
MDFQTLADDLGFDLEEFKELVELFVDTGSADLNSMFSAIEEKNVEKAAKAIHSLKGASGNLGFIEIHQIAKKMEIDARNNRLEEISEPAKLIREKMKAISDQLNG